MFGRVMRASGSVSSSHLSPGSVVLAYLQNPREKFWGVLLGIDQSGVTMRGIDLRSFEDWLRAHASDGAVEIGPSTTFYPLPRVEKILLDEECDGIPSLDAQCVARTGRGAIELLGAHTAAAGSAL
jgi:hypothetical protein